LFLLVRGEVEVLYNIGEEGPAQVDTLSGEEIIGCSALIEPHKYSATERSLTEIEVLEINIPSLLEIMQKDCQLGFKIQQNIIKVLMERIIDLRLAAS
jgi:CRP-like cAMP-binding protein